MAETKLLDVYHEIAHLIRQVRLMDRFFEEVVDARPETRAFLPDLQSAYMDMLNQELAPHALLLAVAVTQLEDAYPEIERTDAPERATAR